MSARRPVQFATLGIVLFVLWLLLSGIYTPWFLGLGVAMTVFTAFMALRMDLLDREGVPVIHLTRKTWTYIPWLLVQIVRSNIVVAKIILRRDLPIRPMITPIRALQKSDLGRVIFANSIALTPGTLVLAMVGKDLHLHSLNIDAAGGVDNDDMNVRVAGIVDESEFT